MRSVGAKRWYVEIEQMGDTVASSGFPTETPTHLCFAYMERVEPTTAMLDGRERFEADQFSASQMTTWRMWWQPDMDPETVDVPKARRLKYEGRIYNIQNAVPKGWRREIELRTLAGGLLS